jgi:hypothetical protein
LPFCCALRQRGFTGIGATPTNLRGNVITVSSFKQKMAGIAGLKTPRFCDDGPLDTWSEVAIA